MGKLIPSSSGPDAKGSLSENANCMLYYIQRVLIIITGLTMFFPSFNPGRISLEITKYCSLFTSAVSYDVLTANLQRALTKGWVQAGSFRILQFSSLAMVIGIVLAIAGGCMSLGNNKMRAFGARFPFAGSILMAGGLAGVYAAYLQVASTSRPEKVNPNFSWGFWFYAVVTLALLVTAILALLREKRFEKEESMKMSEGYKLFLMFLPIVVCAFIFSYLPLWGWRYAFFDYYPGNSLTMDNFVGFKWFTALFNNSATRSDILRVLRNTFAMSGLGIATSWMPMAFAILLAEIRSNRYRKFVQIFTTIPNFISWVLVYAIALAIFSTDGFINSLLRQLGNTSASTNYLMSDSGTWIKMLLWGTWKGIGWSAIIYIAAIAGIDQGLYEAAMIDGANRFERIWHITVPSLLPTYLVLLLMQIAGILSNGLEQYLVFKNAINKDLIEVLDLYVYNLGFDGGQIPLSTVVSMSKSLISVTLLFFANKVSKSVRGESII